MHLLSEFRHLWTPEQVTTSAWYDAADSATITHSGGSVSQWDDKSGNGNNLTQGTGADQPATGGDIGGLNSIQFTSDYMQLDSQIATLRAMFMVTDNLNGCDTTFDSSVLLGEVTAGQSYTFIRMQDNYTISIDGNIPDTGHAGANGSTPTTNGGAGGSTGKNIDLGLSLATKQSEIQWYADWDASIDVDYVGVNVPAPIQKLEGDIGEVILLSSVPDDTTRQKLEGYLAWKWGMTANLPTSHPYKYNPPYA